MSQNAKKQDFEAALAELEKVVADLEREQRLEQALDLFEKGMTLSQECQSFLKSAEQRIEILKRTTSGGLSSEPFVEEAEVV